MKKSENISLRERKQRAYRKLMKLKEEAMKWHEEKAPEPAEPTRFTIGKKEFVATPQEDGSMFVPFTEGRDETKTLKGYVDTEAYDVIPQTETRPIEGAPEFAKQKTEEVVTGAIIKRKDSPAPAEAAPKEADKKPEPGVTPVKDTEKAKDTLA